MASNSRNRTAMPLRMRPVICAFRDISMRCLLRICFRRYRPRLAAKLIGRREKSGTPASRRLMWQRLAATPRTSGGGETPPASAGGTPAFQSQWQTEHREERFGIEEGVPARDAAAVDLEHDQRPRLIGSRLRARTVLRECGRARCRDRHETRAAAPRTGTREPSVHRLRTLQ